MSDSVVILSYCVNQLEGITDGERSLLRDMLMAAQTGQMREWGNNNAHLMETVRVLFEKIKCLIA